MADDMAVITPYTDPAEGREPPYNLEAEQALLGALLVNSKDVLLHVRDIMEPAMFYEPVHGDVYDAICTLDDKGRQANPIALKPYFDTDERLADVGGATYLVRLAASAATIINAPDYAVTVRDCHIRRSIINQCALAASAAQTVTAGSDAVDILEDIETAIHGLHSGAIRGQVNVRSTERVMADALAAMEEAGRCDGIIGYTTGLKTVDRYFSLVPGEYSLLAGRPSMGKSALANVISFAAATGNDKQAPVGGIFFSKEMRAEQNAYRQISCWISIKYQKTIAYTRIRRNDLSDTERDYVNEAVEAIKNTNIYWIDESGLTPARIRMIVKRKQRELERKGVPLGFITVDYIQQIRPTVNAYNETAALTQVSADLLDLIQESNIAGLIVSQLSRQVEMRDNKRPVLSDLRQSGALEQDASNVLFLYRHEYYLKKEKPEKLSAMVDWQMKMDQCSGRAELILSKNRNGPTETICLSANMAANHFSDLQYQGDMLDG